MLPCVTLASEGSAFGITAAAAIQTMSITQRNLTANLPIASENVINVHSPTIAVAVRPPVAGLSLFSGYPQRREMPKRRQWQPAVADLEYGRVNGSLRTRDYSGPIGHENFGTRRRVGCGI